MSNATRGIYLERRVAEDLAALGWFTIRAAGSHGLADVVAIRPGEVVLIQCKTDGQIRGGEWNHLYELARRVGAIPIVGQYATTTHRKIVYVQITGAHRDRSREWPHFQWFPPTVGHVVPVDDATLAKVQELELERLNPTPGRP